MPQGEQKARESWGTRFGFIMAAAGSAIGLGNIWRFPYLTGMNGGGAFIVIYLGCVLFVGLSIMLGEFVVGRGTGLASVGAFKSRHRNWTFVGVLGVISSFFIYCFYPVVGGWAVAYMVKSLTGLLSNPGAIADYFGAFITAPLEPVIWTLIFLAVNLFVVAKGVSGGIELTSKILMPMLFGLLVIIIIKSLSLPGSGAGLTFLFKPDWSVVTGKTFLAALGQAFFSLSLGMGVMITYGSYLKKDEHLPSDALTVVSMDTLAAILAGIAIFPALFAFGVEPTAGTGLVFVVVPQVFAQMGGIGVLFSFVFFLALAIAALTSSVGLLETVVAYFMDEKGMSRKKATYISSAVTTVICILSSLSLGVMSGFSVFGVGVFDFFDILTDKIFLAIGGMCLAIYVGWVLNKEEVKLEATNRGALPFALFETWYAVIKYVIPVLVAVVAVSGIMAIEQQSLMIFGVVVIGVLALFSKKL
ncbi:MAG: Sodium:neurotransmitter symporter family protein [Synergistetes bacterium ADurb.Bin155]|nr:sodium-dependent transporter [Synergistales bacterium]MBP8995708.1 sodium-dependent transporter [Synergistales bacterium]OQB45622.1 MAG: Sodium:neurotransmitter symporter family protein [Synergistetes bacterium ADurb.Bin155]HQL02497.1 sodium-dependent transporter [Synergistales bacterium]